MTEYEHLEMLVLMSHSNEVRALKAARIKDTPIDVFEEDYLDVLLPFFGHIGKSWLNVSYSVLNEIDAWIFNDVDPIVSIASKSSIPTIQEAYQDYLKTFP